MHTPPPKGAGDVTEKNPSISVVIPVFNESGGIINVADELFKTFVGIGSARFIFIDDGSTDRTGEILDGLAKKDRRVIVVHMNKNGGKALAYMEGFKHSNTELTATMDGDGQDNPADILNLAALLQERGVDAIIGQKSWKNPGGYNLMSKISNAVVRAVTGMDLTDMNCPLRVMRTEAVKDLNLKPGMDRFIPWLLAANGRKIAQAPVDNRPRIGGKSHFGVGKYLVAFRDMLAVKMILGTTKQQRRLAVEAGALVAGGGLAMIAFKLAGFHAGLAVSLIGVLMTAMAAYADRMGSS